MGVLDDLLADPSVNGQHVDVDNEFGGQCWDLVELYAERCGVPRNPWAIPLGPEGAAKEAWSLYDSSAHMQAYFDKVPAGSQLNGDILVYGPHGVYTEGHIAICIDRNFVFEENADPDGSPAHTATRSTTYLLGALRIKVSSGGADMIDDNGVPMLRVGHSEIGGWDYEKTHSGAYDAVFLGAWKGKTWPEFIMAQWGDKNAATFRGNRIRYMAEAPMLEQQVATLMPALTTASDDLKKSRAQVADLTKQLSSLKDPNSIIITDKGWSALKVAIKSFFDKNN